jgi:hypothetical protein
MLRSKLSYAGSIAGSTIYFTYIGLYLTLGCSGELPMVIGKETTPRSLRGEALTILDE